MPTEPIAVIHLKREMRDGVLYISSDDLPGLWLWGNDPEAVFSNVMPTITKLYMYNNDINVEIKEIHNKKKGIFNWFVHDQICDTFGVYSIKSKDATDGRLTMEQPHSH